VVRQVAQAVRTPVLSGIDVILDIAPTSCFDPESNNLVDRNLEEFTRYMVTKYRDAFHDHHFIVSCGSADGERAQRKVLALKRMYEELEAQPASIDIHLYETEAIKVRELLLTASNAARRLGVPLDVFETYYDHPNALETISELISAGELSTLRDVLVFPRLTKSACQINVPAPYSVLQLEKRLGRQADAPICR
jgi:hypothetical protein